MSTPSQEYKNAFGLDDQNSEIAEKALEVALDTRKFEIGLYWHRTAYFWALIAASFAGFLAVLSSGIPDRSFYAFAIACVGFIFSLAWFRVNRGSKYWQENWENHVDVLADNIAGPIFKTILYRKIDKDHRRTWAEFVIGPGPVSVSKVNQWVSVFTMAIWLVLGASLLVPLDFNAPISYKRLAVLAVTGLFGYLLVMKTGSELDKHRHAVKFKKSYIADE